MIVLARDSHVLEVCDHLSPLQAQRAFDFIAGLGAWLLHCSELLMFRCESDRPAWGLIVSDKPRGRVGRSYWRHGSCCLVDKKGNVHRKSARILTETFGPTWENSLQLVSWLHKVSIRCFLTFIMPLSATFVILSLGLLGINRLSMDVIAVTCYSLKQLWLRKLSHWVLVVWPKSTEAVSVVGTLRLAGHFSSLYLICGFLVVLSFHPRQILSISFSILVVEKWGSVPCALSETGTLQILGSN